MRHRAHQWEGTQDGPARGPRRELRPTMGSSCRKEERSNEEDDQSDSQEEEEEEGHVDYIDEV